jgi:hypothetical protein
MISGQDLDSQVEANFKDVLDNYKGTLSKLELMTVKYVELGSYQTTIGGKLKRAWKRISIEPEDVRDLQRDINDNTTLLTALAGQLTNSNTGKILQHQVSKEQKANLDRPTPIDYAAQRNDFLKQRQNGARQWLLNSVKFNNWVEAKENTLFCPGIPGAGKMILTSIVVDELFARFQDDHSVAVVYIFCNFTRQNEQTLENLFASMIRQLAQINSPFLDSVKSLQNRYISRRLRPSANDILLLKNGGNINPKDIDKTPLLWAAILGREALVKLLLDAGADIDAKNMIYYTPLLLASWKGYEGVVKLLLKAGVEVEKRTKHGATCRY